MTKICFVLPEAETYKEVPATARLTSPVSILSTSPESRGLRTRAQMLHVFTSTARFSVPLLRDTFERASSRKRDSSINTRVTSAPARVSMAYPG